MSQPIDSLTYLTFKAYVDNNDINVSFTIAIDKQLIKESVSYPINETISLNDASIIIESIELNPMNTVVRVLYDYGSYNWIDTNLKLYVDGYPIGLDGSNFREGISEISFDSIYSKDIKSIEIEVTSADAYKSSKSFDLDLTSLTVAGELGELKSVEIQKNSDEYQLIVTSDESLPTELFFFDNEIHVTMSNKTENRHVYTFTSEENKVSVSRNKGTEHPINKKIIVLD